MQFLQRESGIPTLAETIGIPKFDNLNDPPHQKKTQTFSKGISFKYKSFLFSTTVDSCERVLIVFLVLTKKHCKVKRHLNDRKGDRQLPASSPPINPRLLHQRRGAKALAKEVWRKLITNATRCLQTLPLSTELEGS